MLPDDQPNNVIPFRRRPSPSDYPSNAASPGRPAPQVADQPIDMPPATATPPVADVQGGIDSRPPLAPRISRRLTAMILGTAFVIGIAIAWAAITIGAHIVGMWPFGLASYTILLGGGVTMMLTTGLFMMVLFADPTNRRDRRPPAPTGPSEKQPPGTCETDRSSRRG